MGCQWEYGTEKWDFRGWDLWDGDIFRDIGCKGKIIEYYGRMGYKGIWCGYGIEYRNMMVQMSICCLSLTCFGEIRPCRDLWQIMSRVVGMSIFHHFSWGLWVVDHHLHHQEPDSDTAIPRQHRATGATSYLVACLFCPVGWLDHVGLCMTLPRFRNEDQQTCRLVGMRELQVGTCCQNPMTCWTQSQVAEDCSILCFMILLYLDGKPVRHPGCAQWRVQKTSDVPEYDGNIYCMYSTCTLGFQLCKDMSLIGPPLISTFNFKTM